MRPITFTDYPATPDPEWSAIFKNARDIIAKTHLDSIETAFREAVLKAEGGVMPDNDTIREKGQMVIDPQGNHHLIWGSPKLGIGEPVDMTKCIASVAPPKLFNPTTP